MNHLKNHFQPLAALLSALLLALTTAPAAAQGSGTGPSFSSFDFREGTAWGYVSQAGHYVFPQYEATCALGSWSPYFMARRGGKWALFDHYNRQLTPFAYDDINCSVDLAPDTISWHVTDSQDTENGGKLILDTRHRGFLTQIYPLIAVKTDGRWGYIDYTGRMVIAPQFEEACGFIYLLRDGHSFCLANVKQGKWGVIATDGTTVAPFRKSAPLPRQALLNLAKKAPAVSPTPLVMLSLLNDSLPPLGRYEATFEGEPVVKAAENGQYQILAPDGTPIGNGPYEAVSRRELDVVKVKKAGRYGLVNLNAGEVVPCIFDSIGSFDASGQALAFYGPQREEVALTVYGSCDHTLDPVERCLLQGKQSEAAGKAEEAIRSYDAAARLLATTADDAHRRLFCSSVTSGLKSARAALTREADLARKAETERRMQAYDERQKKEFEEAMARRDESQKELEELKGLIAQAEKEEKDAKRAARKQKRQKIWQKVKDTAASIGDALVAVADGMADTGHSATADTDNRATPAGTRTASAAATPAAAEATTTATAGNRQQQALAAELQRVELQIQQKSAELEALKKQKTARYKQNSAAAAAAGPGARNLSKMKATQYSSALSRQKKAAAKLTADNEHFKQLEMEKAKEISDLRLRRAQLRKQLGLDDGNGKSRRNNHEKDEQKEGFSMADAQARNTDRNTYYNWEAKLRTLTAGDADDADQARREMKKLRERWEKRGWGWPKSPYEDE